MKRALYYAMMGAMYGRPRVESIMAVTSEKGSQVYGRDVIHGNPTHRRADDIFATFETENAAHTGLRLAQEAWDKMDGDVKMKEGQLRRAQRAQRELALDAVSKLSREGRASHGCA